jgi:hypothetical protein
MEIFFPRDLPSSGSPQFPKRNSTPPERFAKRIIRCCCVSDSQKPSKASRSSHRRPEKNYEESVQKSGFSIFNFFLRFRLMQIANQLLNAICLGALQTCPVNGPSLGFPMDQGHWAMPAQRPLGPFSLTKSVGLFENGSIRTLINPLVALCSPHKNKTA